MRGYEDVEVGGRAEILCVLGDFENSVKSREGVKSRYTTKGLIT